MIRYFFKDNVLFASSANFDETYTEITEAEYTQRINEAISKRVANTNTEEITEDVLVEDLEEILVEVEEVVEDVLFE